jgi:hypothetical protein
MKLSIIMEAHKLSITMEASKLLIIMEASMPQTLWICFNEGFHNL